MPFAAWGASLYTYSIMAGDSPVLHNLPRMPGQRAILPYEPVCAIFRRYLHGEKLKFTPERAMILDAVLRHKGLFEAEAQTRRESPCHVQLIGRTRGDQVVAFDGEANLAGQLLEIEIITARSLTLFGRVQTHALAVAN